VIGDVGHGAVNFAPAAPIAPIAPIASTAMIFAPCNDGISQNVIEDARAEHLEAGCNVPPQVMLNAASKLERTRR
jgi:N-carbamoyl-L-amino-acid hydrolase